MCPPPPRLYSPSSSPSLKLAPRPVLVKLVGANFTGVQLEVFSRFYLFYLCNSAQQGHRLNLDQCLSLDPPREGNLVPLRRSGLFTDYLWSAAIFWLITMLYRSPSGRQQYFAVQWIVWGEKDEAIFIKKIKMYTCIVCGRKKSEVQFLSQQFFLGRKRYFQLSLRFIGFI